VNLQLHPPASPQPESLTDVHRCIYDEYAEHTYQYVHLGLQQAVHCHVWHLDASLRVLGKCRGRAYPGGSAGRVSAGTGPGRRSRTRDDYFKPKNSQNG
jgi:hypothetical protein